MNAAHLDSNYLWHHDACVRTTVTLDTDVEKLLRDCGRCGTGKPHSH